MDNIFKRPLGFWRLKSLYSDTRKLEKLQYIIKLGMDYPSRLTFGYKIDRRTIFVSGKGKVWEKGTKLAPFIRALLRILMISFNYWNDNKK